MQLTLTQTERAVLKTALENYRKNRAAQGKLDEHKQLKTDPDGAARTREQYARLSTVILGLLARVSSDHDA